MFSKDESSSSGRSLNRNTGSVCTVRIGSRIFPVYPLVTVCLGLLNTFLLLAAVVIGINCGKVIDEYTPYHEASQNLIIEARQLQIMHSEAIKAEEEAKKAVETELSSHQQIKQQLEQHKTHSDAFQNQIQALQAEKETLQSNISDIQGSCGRCLTGWFLLNTSCYFHAKPPSHPSKNWTESRADCISRGADLAVINSWEEQENLFEYLPKLDRSIRPWWKGIGIWIGITDSQTEGTWLWINNVTQADGGYWIPGEPNNYGQRENCGAIMNTESPRRSWYDADCTKKKEWLCEIQLN